MKKKLLSLLLLACMAVSIIGCGKTNTNKPDTNSGNNNTQVSTEQNSEDEKADNDCVLTNAKLDRYNNNTKANYLSAVLYNPDLTYKSNSKDEYSKYVVYTYPMGKEYTQSELINYKANVNSEYYFDGLRIGMDDIILDACVTYGDISSAAISFLQIKDDKIVHNAFCSPNIYKDDKSSTTSTYGDTGHFANADIVERVFIEVCDANKEGYKVFCALAMNEALEREQLSPDKVNDVINNNKFIGTAYMLNSLSDLTSVDSKLGKDNVNLNETLFVQDMLAEKVSAIYGLNVRDKYSFIHSERDYILYYDCNNKVRVTFLDAEYVTLTYDNKSDYSYDTTLAETKQSITFKDKNNDEYTYMVSKYAYGINKDTVMFVFKNKEFVGGVSVSNINKKDLFEQLNCVFGTNN